MELDFFYRYPPVGDDDRRRGLHVSVAGHTRVPPHTRYPPTQHPDDYHFSWHKGRVLAEFQVVYITRGRGTFESAASGKIPIAAGQAFALFPGVWHRYMPDKATGWDEYYVGFNGPLAPRLMADHALSPDVPVQAPGLDEALVASFIRLFDELRGQQAGYQHLLAAGVVQILARIRVAVQRRPFAGQPVREIIEKARAALMERTDQRVNVARLARELHVGYSRFRRAFRDYTGMPPAQYHLQLRLNKAKDLLRNTRRPVGQIARDTGFDSIFYFSRLFKAKTGQTPREFRTMHQGGASRE
ncbi:MAG: AraC family transcriptional regulator [Candidatus Hydrogenedentes bacterium]|nr:AraC family transcriptional regulator [Candidatus Hydrogenedentota bacterium]